MQRIQLDDPRELRAGPGDDPDLEPETLGDLTLRLPGNLVGLRLARQDDVAALKVRAHLLEAGRGQNVAELRHRDAVARAEVDPAQEDDVLRHAA